MIQVLQFFRLIVFVVSNKICSNKRRSILVSLSVCIVVFISVFAWTVLSSIERSMTQGFQRLGADLMIVAPEARVNKTQALLAVPPNLPELSPDVYEKAVNLTDDIEISAQNASQIGTQTVYGFDPLTDFTVIPWLADDRGIDFQSGQIILGSQIQGRLGDRVRLNQNTFQIYGHLVDTGVPSHQSGMFVTLEDWIELQSSNDQLSRGVSGFLVKNCRDQSVDQLKFTLLAQLDDVQVVGGRTLLSLIRGPFLQVRKITLAIALLALICLGLLNGMLFASIASERQREVGIFLTMGALPKQLVTFFIVESLSLSLLGSIISAIFIFFSSDLVYGWLSRQFISFQMPLLWRSLDQQVIVFLIVSVSISLTIAFASYWPIRRMVDRDPLALVQSHE